VNPQTKIPIASAFRPGFTHRVGTEVTLVEPLDGERLVWITEIRVPTDQFEGDAWYDYVELKLTDLDFQPALKEAIRIDVSDNAAIHPTPFDDVAVETSTTSTKGSDVLPRKAVAA
jgi:hypothetical protein